MNDEHGKKITDDAALDEKAAADADKADDVEPAEQNPPITTSKGWFTTPKFGSATSGGGEIEPGPERD